MGVALTKILKYREVSISELSGKVFAVDAFNIIYQFLSTIRSRDGALLTDSKGDVTSHLIGIFYRFSKLMEQNMKFVFVFDGTPPYLKHREEQARKAIKDKAQKRYELAKEKKDEREMLKYASRTTHLTQKMIEDAKTLLKAMGIPIIQAPSEGEAQAALLVKNKDCYAVLSQDTDSFLFGATRFLKDLTISQKRKKASTLSYEKVIPKIYNLSENLNLLGIDQDQFIALSLLVGTDYNPKGIKGIGPKKALKLVKKHGKNFDALFKEVKWDETSDTPWTEIFYLIKNIKLKKDYKIAFKKIDEKTIQKILIEEHEFNEERINNVLKKLKKKGSISQKGLAEFIK